MKTKDFNNILQNVPYKEVTSGEHLGVELLCGNYLVVFDLDCDIDVEYYSGSTYLNPEEYDLKETKDILITKILSEDYEQEFELNEMQMHKLVQEISTNLKVIY